MPFWTFFAAQPALRALDEHLAAADPYRHVDVLLFQHGVRSPGSRRRRSGWRRCPGTARSPRLVGLDPRRFPHDIGALGRYGPALAALPPARKPWTPLTPDAALAGLRSCGLRVDADG